jgi:hemerythrin-like domain-containing protein
LCAAPSPDQFPSGLAKFAKYQARAAAVFYTYASHHKLALGLGRQRSIARLGQGEPEYKEKNMLTATYSLVALSVEQKNARCTLSAVQQYIRSSAREARDLDPNGLQSAIQKLAQLDQYCHERKVELYVIPAIRNATHEADPLLEEIESLNSRGMDILRSLRDAVGAAIEQGVVKVEEICHAMEQYCNNLMQRLMKEEELFQIARRVISGEGWFSIAANFLSYDAQQERRRRQALFDAHSMPLPIAV